MKYVIKIGNFYVADIILDKYGAIFSMPMTEDKAQALIFTKVGEARKKATEVGGTVEEL